MLFVLRALNSVLLASLVACMLGAMTGLIVFAPFLAGAWLLDTIAIVGLERLAETEANSPLLAAASAHRDSTEATDARAAGPPVRAIT